MTTRSGSPGFPAIFTALRIGVPAVVLSVASLVLSVLASAGGPAGPYPPTTRGHDISFPQCNRTLPDIQEFAVIGVNGGRPFTQNPCLFSEYAWATLAPAEPTLYINTSGAFGSRADEGNSGPAGTCQPVDTPCIAFNYGFNAARDAHAYATSEGVTSQVWWLDVETANSWWSETAYNAGVIQGMHAYFALSGLTVGVYSTNYQWNLLMGSYRPDIPVWYATAAGYAGAPAYCADAYNFAGGGVWLVQYYGGEFDADYACGEPAADTPTSTTAPTPTETPTATMTPEATETPPGTTTPGASETPPATPPPAVSETPSATPSATDTATATATASRTATAVASPTAIPTDTSTPPPTPTPTPLPLTGDVNCDGVVDSIDAALVLQYEAALLASLACQQSGDASGDGAVDAVDAALILQHVAGYIGEL